jgi:hypothetical protein
VTRGRLLPAFVVLGSILLADMPASLVVLHIARLRVERATLRAQAAQEPYRGTDWGTAYWREIASYQERWDPHVVYRVGEMNGRFINVVHGVRKTYTPPGVSGRPRRLIFVFGGSAAWGHGARDLETIPSWLARVGEEHRDLLDVRNYAESGWVNWQGIAYLIDKLAEGERPEIVIFFSGVNETLGARQWPELRRPIWDAEFYVSALSEAAQQRNRPLSRAWRYYRHTSLIWSTLLPLPAYVAPSAQTSLEAVTRMVSSDYLSDKAMVEALGREFGFSTLFVWQPIVADKAELSRQERRYAGWLPASPDTTPALSWWSLPRDLRATYEAIGHAVKSRGVVGLAGAFDGVSATAFIDWMHPSELGNELIARALYSKLPAPTPGQQDLSRGTICPAGLTRAGREMTHRFLRSPTSGRESATNPSRFGIFTFGRLVAFMTPLSSMMPLRLRTNATAAYTSDGWSRPG